MLTSVTHNLLDQRVGVSPYTTETALRLRPLHVDNNTHLNSALSDGVQQLVLAPHIFVARVESGAQVLWGWYRVVTVRCHGAERS